MRHLRDISVAHAVLHLVAPRIGQLQRSQAELPLDADVAKFLAGHVDHGLHDSQAKAANFEVRGPDRAADLCDELLGDATRLVETSQQLAELLYKVMEHDGRVSDGTLAVLLCDATGAGGNPERFLALLKLDPSAAYRTVTTTDPEGRQVLRLEMESDILPTVRERVQKCAFIRAPGGDDEYQLLLVDRQRGPGTVSRFFVADFLGAAFILDAPERTRRLYRALKAAYNEVAPDLEPDQVIALDRSITGAVSGLSVNLDETIRALPVNPPVRDRIDEIVSRRLPDREFELDVEVARQFVRRRYFEGDNGLRLSVPADFLDAMITVEEVEDLVPARRRIIIETTTWRER